ncbi:MAG: hypothetical protein AAGD06_32235, partial [Acidobacteriota bacterium]
CPPDPTAIRLAVQLTRWTIHRSKPRALRYAEMAWRACKSLDLDRWTASNLRPMVLSQLAKCVEATGGDGEFLIRRAIAELKTSTGKRERADTLFLAAAVLRLKDREQAIEAAGESADHFDALGDAHNQGRALVLLASLVEERGDPLRKSLDLINRALGLVDFFRDSEQWKIAALIKADLELMSGNPLEAGEALGWVRGFRSPSYEIQRVWIEARFHICSDRVDAACRALGHVTESYALQGHQDLLHGALADLAVALQKSGRSDLALATAEKVHEYFSRVPDPPLFLNVMEQIAENREVSLGTLQRMWRTG